MEFRNYCVIIMGKFDKAMVLEQIKKISENPINSIDSGGVLIGTFTSIFEPSEIGDIFNSFGLNSLVFDLDVRFSSANFQNPMLQEGLFNMIKQPENLEDMTSRLLKDIAMSSSTKNQGNKPKPRKPKKTVNNHPTEADIAKMTKDEKENWLNKFIDEGLDNLSDYDKKLIELLAK